MVDPHWIRAGSITGGGTVAVVGTFLPWLGSGATDRSSYEMFSIVDRLGFSPDGLVGWAIRLWPLVPLLFVVAAIVQWNVSIRRGVVWLRRLAPLAAALYAGGVAAALQFAPEAGLIRVRYGAWVTVAGAVAVFVAAAWPVRPPAVAVSPRGSAASGDA